MSGCAIRRWGAGSGCGGGNREPNTEASKEMAAKLAAMRAERDRQDTMWLAPAATEPEKPASQVECRLSLAAHATTTLAKSSPISQQR